ncbi:hypothetical protein PTI98_009090 [Pleurotus ostreatus]|nr:hypothetical protein PTI98_009090 [Pleurotus ostreatus]
MENSRKRKRETLEAEKCKNTHQAPSGYSSKDEEGDENEEAKGQTYSGPTECLQAIHAAFKSAPHVSFIGQYELDVDPLKTTKEEVRMVSYEIWRASGYKFRYENRTVKWLTAYQGIPRVHDNPKIATGYKTRYWCCQDEGQRQRSRPSQQEGAVPRDNVGMKRFACQSRLTITCKLATPEGGVSLKRTIRIAIEHHTAHVPYYDVSVPPGHNKVVDSNIIAQGEHLSAREKVVSEGLQNMLRILDHNNELASIDWYGHRIRYVDDAMTLLAVCN